MALQQKIMNDSNTFDVIIIGAGPSSFSASIYLANAGYKVAYIEKNVPGGRLVNIPLIVNYPGFKQISGADLALNMYEQAEASGVIAIFGEVTQIGQYKNYHVVYTSDGATRYTKALVLATGMLENKLMAKNAEEYEHKGVSYCAICDGVFAKDKDVIVIGGGDSALSNALYLSKICKQVYVVVRRDQFRAKYVQQEQLSQVENIQVIFNSNVVTVLGDGNKVTGVEIKNNQTNEVKQINCDYIFNYTGSKPSNQYIIDKSILDENNKIIHNEKMETTIPGLYAIGDVTNNQYQQITIAVANGTVAALNIINYLNNWK